MVVSSSEALEGFRPRARLERPSRIGRLVEPLAHGPVGLFDLANTIVLDLPGGELASADTVAVLNGANRIAILGANGAWEIIAFRQASEIAPGRWQLSGLLRALHGTEDAMASGHAVDAQAVVLDETVRPLGLDIEEVGRLSNWIVDAVGTPQGQAGPYAFAGGERALTPLAPVHLRGRRAMDGSVRFSWMRRGRVDSDTWLATDIPLDEPNEAYRLEILAGASVVRRFDVASPSCNYPGTSELADFGGMQASIAIRVRQLGRAIPLGLAAEAIVNL